MTLRLEQVAVGASPAGDGLRRLAGTVHSDVDGLTEALWLDLPAATLELDDASIQSRAGNLFLAWLAPLAAVRREDLVLRMPVDGRLLVQVREVLQVWRAWYPELAAVHLEAPVRTAREATAHRTASMFTGGVDSFFTALRHGAGEGTPRSLQIDDLLYVHGFDVPLANRAAAGRVADTLRQAAAGLGRRLVMLTTNLRETRFAATDWPRLSHGAALAGVAHALGGRYDTVLIGSSAGYRDLRPWGSHPLTDPLFSSDGLSVLHDGAGFMRVEKTEYVIRSPVARRHLRVCWRSPKGDNCNACNNCFRTMLALEALGVLDDCAGFDRGALDLARVARIYCRHDFDVRQFSYVRELAQRCGRPDLVHAVDRALHGSQRLGRRLALVQRLRGRRVVGRWAPAWERRLLRGWID